MARWWYRKRPKAWIDWRTNARIRDNYKCVLCGQHRKYMDPHHRRRWKLFPKLIYHPSNVATLCRKCHKKMFRKEMQWVERLVDILFGGLGQWKLSRHCTMLKNQWAKAEKLRTALSEKRIVGKDPEPMKSSGKDPVKPLKFKTGSGKMKQLRKGHRAGQD